MVTTHSSAPLQKALSPLMGPQNLPDVQLALLLSFHGKVLECPLRRTSSALLPEFPSFRKNKYRFLALGSTLSRPTFGAVVSTPHRSCIRIIPRLFGYFRKRPDNPLLSIFAVFVHLSGSPEIWSVRTKSGSAILLH